MRPSLAPLFAAALLSASSAAAAAHAHRAAVRGDSLLAAARRAQTFFQADTLDPAGADFRQVLGDLESLTAARAEEPELWRESGAEASFADVLAAARARAFLPDGGARTVVSEHRTALLYLAGTEDLSFEDKTRLLTKAMTAEASPAEIAASLEPSPGGFVPLGRGDKEESRRVARVIEKLRRSRPSALDPRRASRERRERIDAAIALGRALRRPDPKRAPDAGNIADFYFKVAALEARDSAGAAPGSRVDWRAAAAAQLSIERHRHRDDFNERFAAWGRRLYRALYGRAGAQTPGEAAFARALWFSVPEAMRELPTESVLTPVSRLTKQAASLAGLGGAAWLATRLSWPSMPADWHVLSDAWSWLTGIPGALASLTPAAAASGAWEVVALGFLWGFISSMVVVIANLFSKSRDTGKEWGVPLLTVTLGAGVMEEIFWRIPLMALFFGLLSLVLPASWALWASWAVISGWLFGLMHKDDFWWGRIPSGLLFGYLMLTHGVWVAVAAHAFNNLLVGVYYNAEQSLPRKNVPVREKG